jgi:copper transport protein
MTRPFIPGRRRLSRASALAMGVLLLFPASALGHAAFVGSTPAPGTRLESPPTEVRLTFTEPLNRRLASAKLVAMDGGRPIAVGLVASDRRLTVTPAGPLPRGAYRVDWHTVSTQDGHALEGSFSFGVRVPAEGGEHEVVQSPLARGGWLRIAVRAIFYAALLFFAGGLLTATLLSRRSRPGGWLVPETIRTAITEAGHDPDEMADRAWRRTLEGGWIAAGAAAVVAVVEAADAGGGLNARAATDFLFSNAAGVSRVLTVVAVLLALAVARRSPPAAAAWAALGLLAVAVGGHANSAEPRALALGTDWLHLVAASVWVGGIAHVAATWLRPRMPLPRRLRREVMRVVLQRFGAVALPAFAIVASTGLTNALIELGHLDALWQTAYGRVLAAKIALVGLIALASYLHAVRLRPRLLAMNPHPPERLEHRHWLLLRSEPALGMAVVVAAAVLVVFPLPPRQGGETAEAARPSAACDPCPLRRPDAQVLGVAEQAGSSIVAAWVHRTPTGLAGKVRLLGKDAMPVPGLRLLGADSTRCGRGCLDFRTRDRPRELRVRVSERGRAYRARLPVRWDPGGNRRARRLLERAQSAMARLRSVRQREQLTSGPGTGVSTEYELQAPDRFTYRVSSGATSITIGKRQWTRTGDSDWMRQPYAGGGPGFRTRSWFRWTSYARAMRLLSDDGRTARLALMDEATPVWLRLAIDLRTMRVQRVRMIAERHYMTHRFRAFNAPLVIRPPRRDGR